MNPKKITLKIICIVVIISFIFPFLMVSCDNYEVATLSAKDLITGVTIEGEAVDPVPLAIILSIIAIIAFLTAFLKGKLGILIPMISNIVSTILVLILKSQAEETMAREGLSVTLKFGFYLMISSMIAAVLYSIYLALNKHKD